MILVIHDPIYVQDVLVVIGESSEAAIIRAIAKAGYNPPDVEGLCGLLDLTGADGRTVLDSDSGAVVIRLNRLRKGNAEEVSHLVHECVHAATMLFGRIGFPLKSKTDEPLAYYVAFLVRSVLEKV